jgi:predicted phage baseplate assembly protein
VKAVYRNGIGKSGNVKADKITLLSSRPPGVKEVTNPLRASGGADRESRDQARVNAPLAVMALDRLVSTQDYADFARTFAGIGKANAERLSTGNELVLHVTIAGADDIPIDRTSDLYRNLVRALRDFGDPLLPLQVDVRELLALILSARVRALPDYDWEFVAPAIRARLVDAFGFERRDLGQPVFLSEVITVIQRVAGVAWVDVDVLHAIAESELSAPAALARTLADLAGAGSPAPHVLAARSQLAIFVADAPDTIILNEVTREP